MDKEKDANKSPEPSNTKFGSKSSVKGASQTAAKSPEVSKTKFASQDSLKDSPGTDTKTPEASNVKFESKSSLKDSPKDASKILSTAEILSRSSIKDSQGASKNLESRTAKITSQSSLIGSQQVESKNLESSTAKITSQSTVKGGPQSSKGEVPTASKATIKDARQGKHGERTQAKYDKKAMKDYVEMKSKTKMDTPKTPKAPMDMAKMFNAGTRKGQVKKETGRSRIEVAQGIEHMVGFIFQEGEEKADAIDAKTEEEVNILKGEMINSDKIITDIEYDKKMQKLEMSTLTYKATLANKARMDLLEQQRKMIDLIQKETSEQIDKDMTCHPRYANILILMIVECMFKLMESPIFVRCREQDLVIVEKILPYCERTYVATSNQKIQLEIDKEIFLVGEKLGGIIMYTHAHKIQVKNTLDTRLSQAVNHCSPPIGRILFGRVQRIKDQKN